MFQQTKNILTPKRCAAPAKASVDFAPFCLTNERAHTSMKRLRETVLPKMPIKIPAPINASVK